MKRILITSLIIFSMLGLAGCADSGDNSNQQAPPPAEQSQNVEDTGDNTGDDTSKFVYDPKEVKELDLHIELKSGEEWDYDFDRDDQEAEIESENGKEVEKEGAEAFQEIEGLLSAINIDLDRPINEMINEILGHLKIQRDNIEEIEFEIEMFSSEKVGFKYHIGQNNDTVDEFEMEIDFKSGVEWEYDYDLRDSEFEIEYSDRNDLSGQEAKNEMERILSSVSIGLDKSIAGMKKEFLAAVEVTEDKVKEWEFEVEYMNGETIKAKHNL